MKSWGSNLRTGVLGLIYPLPYDKEGVFLEGVDDDRLPDVTSDDSCLYVKLHVQLVVIRF